MTEKDSNMGLGTQVVTRCVSCGKEFNIDRNFLDYAPTDAYVGRKYFAKDELTGINATMEVGNLYGDVCDDCCFRDGRWVMFGRHQEQDNPLPKSNTRRAVIFLLAVIAILLITWAVT